MLRGCTTYGKQGWEACVVDMWPVALFTSVCLFIIGIGTGSLQCLFVSRSYRRAQYPSVFFKLRSALCNDAITWRNGFGNRISF
jgi:hypothetical protein